MIFGFVIWNLVSLMIVGVGIRTWKSEKAAGFYSGIRPSEISDVRKYNRATAVLWFIYAGLFELLGFPLLFMKHHSGMFAWSIMGVVVITAALPAAYYRILCRYKKE